MKHKLRLRRGAALTVALLAPLAPSQVVRPQEDNPIFQANRAVMQEANKVFQKAMAFLNAGDDAGAERESGRYLVRVEALEPESQRRMVSTRAQRILAEVYARRGRFRQALEMSWEKAEGATAGLNARGTAVKAVAYAGLGRMDEARTTLALCLDMDNVPVRLHGDRADLPNARDRSAAAIAATAWLIHGLEVKDDDNTLPRARRSIEEALRLAPKNPVVALNAARFYREHAQRPDLARKALAAAAGGSRETRELIRVEEQEIDQAAKVKPEGSR